MANTPLRMASAQLGVAMATYYTAPAAKKAIVTQIVLTNVTASHVTASISLVASGGAASAANRIVEQLTVPAYGVVTIDLKQVLETGEFLAALAGAAASVNMRVSGVEVG